MTTQNEFKTFYEVYLKPKLLVLENQRKSIVIKLFFVLISYGVLMRLAISLMTLDQNWMLEVIIIVTLVGVWIIFFYDKKTSFYLVLILIMIILVSMYQGGQFWVLTSIIIMILLSVGIKIFYNKIIPPYKQNFKREIISDIVTYVDESFNYDPEKKIPREEFQASRLFEQDYGRTVDKWTGEDYVEGVLDATLVKLSEVQAEEYETNKEGDSHYETLFKGLFFVFNFHLNFEGITIIVPNYVKPNFFNRLFGKNLPSWKTKVTHLNLVELTTAPEFEREFLVYSDTPIMARQFLSNTLMHRLLVFRYRLNKAVYLSFTNGKLFLAIDVSKDLFEPSIFRTLLNFQLIQEFFEYMQLGKDIVDELNIFLVKPNISSKGSFRFETSNDILTKLQIPGENLFSETKDEELTTFHIPIENSLFEKKDETLVRFQISDDNSPIKIEDETLTKLQIPTKKSF